MSRSIAPSLPPDDVRSFFGRWYRPANMVVENARNPAFSSNCSADLKAKGGKGSIAEQIAASSVDVVLGGGRWLGGPGVEVSLEQKHARHDIARGECHDGDVTRRTQLFVRNRVGEKIPP